MRIPLGLPAAALVATCAAFAQELRIEHFAQRGERWDALAKNLPQATARVVLGGLPLSSPLGLLGRHPRRVP